MQKAGPALCLFVICRNRKAYSAQCYDTAEHTSDLKPFCNMHCKTGSCQEHGRCCRGICKGSSALSLPPHTSTTTANSGEKPAFQGVQKVLGPDIEISGSPFPFWTSQIIKKHLDKIWYVCILSALKTFCDEGTTISLREAVSCLTIKILTKLFLAPISTSSLLQIKLITSYPIPSRQREQLITVFLKQAFKYWKTFHVPGQSLD